MRLNVKEGRTLLVDGPASVNLLSGSAKVLGAGLEVGSKVVVRNGKRLPFEVIRNADFELTLGENSSFLEIDGGTIPKSWKDAVDGVLFSGELVSILVMGDVDRGKTSFCTYLANHALKKGRKVGIIDGDLGQSDIGPPATVGLARVVKPIVGLFDAQAESVAFVGATTPSKAFNASLNALKTLKSKSQEMDIDFLIVNTDGWVEGEDAINHKDQVVELFGSTAVIVIREDDELEPLLNTLRGLRTFIVESPKTVRKRGHETRKTLRELAYRKYLKDAKVLCCSLGHIKIKEGSIEHGDPISSDLMRMIDDEGGPLVGLEGSAGKFLGIGILHFIDLKKRILKVYTPVRGIIQTIHIGRVRLSLDGNELTDNPDSR